MRPIVLRPILQLLQRRRQRQLLQPLLQLPIPAPPLLDLQLGSNPRRHRPRQHHLRHRTHLRAPTHRHLPPLARRQRPQPARLPRHQQPQHLRQLHQPDPLRPRPAVDRHQIRLWRQHQNARLPPHRRAPLPALRRQPRKRTRLPKHAPQRPQSPALRRQHPVNPHPRPRPAGPRRRILHPLPLPRRPARLLHLQGRLHTPQNLLRQTRHRLRARGARSLRRQRAVGGRLPDMAGAVPIADRQRVAGLEEREGSSSSGANYTKNKRVGDVAGAVGRSEYADGDRAVESRAI